MKVTGLLTLGLVVVLGVGMLPGCSDDSGNGTSTDKIVIGAIFHDKIAESAKLRLDAIKLAIEEINASKVFDKELTVINRSPAVGDSPDEDKAKENAKKLYDDDKAVGVISLFSSVGKAIISVTQAAPYDKFVQCNCSATSPTLNSDEDKTDTFYRTVVDDLFQGKLMGKVMEENSWTKVGVYYVDDSFGQGLLQQIKNNASAYGYTVALEEKHASSAFDVTAEQATLDKIVTESKAGNIDALALPTLKAQAPSIVKYLTENGFVGAIVLSDGAKTEDMFTIATGINSWLSADTKNKIMGTEPDTLGGTNSAKFESNFQAKIGTAANTYSPTAYDCAYAMAFALVASGDTEYTATSVHTGIKTFTEANFDDTATAYGLGGDEFKKAADALGGGSKIKFDGASGVLKFTNDGDRPTQSMRTFKINASADAWEKDKSYTPADLEPAA